MVRNSIVSRFAEELPNGRDRRGVSGEPLYPTEDVLTILQRFGIDAVIPWTQKCIKDIQKWQLDADDLVELVKIALSAGRFRGSAWCKQSPSGPRAACDAYSLVRGEWFEHANKHMNIEYYIKFAISKSGKCLLMVSCHPSEQRI
jgi:hypothetical protein